MLASKFSSLPYNLKVLKNEKAIFKVADENTLIHTPFYSEDEFFVCEDL